MRTQWSISSTWRFAGNELRTQGVRCVVTFISLNRVGQSTKASFCIPSRIRLPLSVCRISDSLVLNSGSFQDTIETSGAGADLDVENLGTAHPMKPALSRMEQLQGEYFRLIPFSLGHGHCCSSIQFG